MEIHYGDVDTDYEALELTLLNGPAWTHSLDGNHLFGMPTDLGYYPIALQLDDGMDTMVDTLHLHVEHFRPVITSVEDVPNDQGGREELALMHPTLIMEKPTDNRMDYIDLKTKEMVKWNGYNFHL